MHQLKEQIDSDLNFTPQQNRSPQQITNQNSLFDEERQKLVKYHGKYITCWKNSKGQPRIFLGPHFYVFIITLIICSCLLALLLYSLKEILSWFWFLVLVGCSLGFACSYIWVGVSNPGILSAQVQPSIEVRNDPKFCKKCKIVKNKYQNVYHCEYCDVCIEGFDHHCPWVGKCVGKKNLFPFYLFLAMTFGTLIMCFVATIASGGGNASFHRTNGSNKQKNIKYM